VTFQLQGIEDFKFCESRVQATPLLLFVVQAIKSVRDGAQAYLTYVQAKPEVKSKLEDISIVRNYLDGFCKSHGIATRSGNRVHHWLGVGNSADSKGTVPYGSNKIKKVEGAASRVVWSGFHSSKCVTVGSAGAIYEEEGQVYAAVHKLLWAKPGDN
jgi:hypothetical protein